MGREGLVGMIGVDLIGQIRRALTMDEALGEERSHHLLRDYSDLSSQTQANVEAALFALSATGRSSAATVFATMAQAVGAGSNGGGSEVHALVVDYVAKVADIWRRAGLQAGPAFYPSSSDMKKPINPKRPTDYKSSFHRFADLVLTALVEPWSVRHDDIGTLKQQIAAATARLPAADRQRVAATPRRCDIDWLVSDDHLKKALRRPFQKTGAETP